MKFSKNLKFTILLPAAVLVIGLIVGIICGGMNLGRTLIPPWSPRRLWTRASPRRTSR